MSWMRNLEISTAFATVLKKHRAAKGFSQELLAEKAEIHPTHVSLIERSERNPSLNVSQAIAHALGLSLTQMVGEAEQLQGRKP
jgi:transcriptional regulator with XRE-family HTH domain